MSMTSDPRQLEAEGKLAFERSQFESAARAFRYAAEAYAAIHDDLNEAEQKSNLSVALLQGGRAQQALEAVRGTAEVFAQAGDPRRQGIAANNEAAALERLGRPEEALAAYEKAAALLAEAGERELRALALKSAASLQLRRGKIAESGLRMIGVLEAREHPSMLERVLRALLHLVQR